jgi:DNA-directed RNA polymerase subunit beta'
MPVDIHLTEEQRKAWTPDEQGTKFTHSIARMILYVTARVLYMMTFSGARGNISQIRQLVGMRGLMSNSQGQIIKLPIKSNLKEGLSITEYFISCYGARKGLVDTALKTANSGYLTRRLIYAVQGQIIKQPNCKTKNGILINNFIKNKKDLQKKKDKLIGRILAIDIKDKKNGRLIASKGQDICNYLAKKIINVQKILIRSPLNCRLNNGTCQACYGWNLGNGRMSELGESIGIIAAQSIGEPGTQLTMRTFHTGGVFSSEVAESIIAPQEGRINYTRKNGKKIITKFGEKAFFTLEEKGITIEQKTHSFKKIRVKIPKYTLIFSKPNSKVFENQIIAETCNWKDIKEMPEQGINETKEIKTNISGIIEIAKTQNEKKKDQKIQIISGTIISIYNFYEILEKRKKSNNFLLVPIKWKRKLKNKMLNNKKLKVLFLTNVKNLKKARKVKFSIIKVIISKKQIFTKKKETEKTLKINQKNKKLKIGYFLSEGSKLENNVKLDYDSQVLEINSQEIRLRKSVSHTILDLQNINNINKNLVKKNNTLFYIQYKKKQNEDIVQGLPRIEELLEAKKTSELKIIKNNSHELLKVNFDKFALKYQNKVAVRKSLEKIQLFLIKKIQSVYEAQGVKISDKHMEIIVKQMTSKVIITEQGESKIIVGETIELNKIEKINKNLRIKAQYEPILLGITKISLSNQSFISEASFQETTKILTKSAIQGKIDWLYGIKENLILGNLIPVGTGYKK